MKKVIKETKKFSMFNANKVYYTIFRDKLCQIRLLKAEFSTTCCNVGTHTFVYEVAGFGIFTNNALPYIYNTIEDAIKDTARIKNFCNGNEVIYYCADNSLISYNYINSYYYINAFRWNDYKVVCDYGRSNVGIEINVNLINGNITITCEEGVYTNAEECAENNDIICLKF